MHLLAYWRVDNYLRDLDEGAGFNFNSRQARLHTAIEPGESLWLFTALKNPPRFFVAARLVVRSKTTNPTGYKYGTYRVWGDLQQSRYFRLRPDEPADEAFDVLCKLSLTSGSLAKCTRMNLPQACQTIRGIAESGDRLLERFTGALPTEERAVEVADEYLLERELSAGGPAYEDVLRRDHTGPSEDRRQRLLLLAGRDRELVKTLHERYCGRCQLCAFDSPVVYGTSSAEAHHVVYLSRGGEDSLENMVLLCPNHHTVIHKTDATFDYSHLKFLFPNGRTEPLCLNFHLSTSVISAPANPGASRMGHTHADTGLETLTTLIQSELTPNLLTPEWAKSRREGDHPLTGYCYVASEALYHLAGGASAGLSIYRCKLGRGRTHWWLADSDGRIVDATADQFTEPPPYPNGRRTHFLSANPSTRASRLIAKVQARLA